VEDEILQVQNLTVNYRLEDSIVKGIENVSFGIKKSSITAIIGESGSGKTTLLSAILGFLPQNARISGKIIFNNEKIMENGKYSKKFRTNRWRLISYIPQNAMSVLSPLRKIRSHFIDTAMAYNIPKEVALNSAKEILPQIGLDEKILNYYPFELSGGMKQRVVIALAIFLRPLLTVADEPTSALDVITQKKILDLLKKINNELNITFLVSTHDISVASYVADEIIVLYNGHIVERGSKEAIINHPLHPYTLYLLSSVISLSSKNKLIEIREKFMVKHNINKNRGCPFYSRCPFATTICSEEFPPNMRINDHEVLCNKPFEVEKSVYT